MLIRETIRNYGMILSLIFIFNNLYCQFEYNGYREPSRDGICPADVGLANDWSVFPNGQPGLLWQTNSLGIIGIDHTKGQLAVYKDNVYAVTYFNGNRTLFCINDSGNTAWSQRLNEPYGGTHDPNPSPWVWEDRVYIHDAGHDYCFDAFSGEELWKSQRDGDTKDSPVIVDGVHLMRQSNDLVAKDAFSGDEIWRYSPKNTLGSTGSPFIWHTPYKKYVLHSSDENNEIICADPLTGDILWKVDPSGTGLKLDGSTDGVCQTCTPFISNDILISVERALEVGEPQTGWRVFPDEPTRQPELLWENGNQVVKCAGLIHQGYAFWGWTTRQNALVQCMDIYTGEVKYFYTGHTDLKSCLKGYGDLVLADGKLYGNTCLSTTMAWPNPVDLDVISSHDNNANHMTTPTIVNGKMYLLCYDGYNQGGESVCRVKCYDISAPAGAKPVITQRSLPDGKKFSWYSQRLWVASGNGYRTWRVSEGVLPAGLKLDSTRHMIHGYPTVTGNYTFTLEVRDEDGDMDSKVFTIQVEDNTVVEVAGISVSLDSLELGTGLTHQLNYAVYPSNASDNSVSWSSSNESIALVDDSGIVTGVSPGNTLIIAKSNAKPELQDTTIVFVHEVNHQPTIDQVPDLNLVVNAGMQQVSFTGVSDGDNWTQQVNVLASTPDTNLIKDLAVDYTTLNTTGSLTFTPNTDSTGLATIFLTVIDDCGVVKGGADTRRIAFTVIISGVPSDVPGRVEAEDYNSVIGDVQTSGSGDTDGTPYVGWYAQGEELVYNLDISITGEYLLTLRVATDISTGGALDIKFDGTVSSSVDFPRTGGWVDWKSYQYTIFLSEGNHDFSILNTGSSVNINWFELNLNNTPVEQISILDCPGGYLKIDSSWQLSTMVMPLNAVDKSVSWSSSNESIAMVDGEGNVKGISEGIATIIATSSNGLVDSCQVAVNNQVIVTEDVQIVNCPGSGMAVGATYMLEASVQPIYADDISVKWTVDDDVVAGIDSISGLLTAREPGNVLVSVKTNDNGLTDQCAIAVKDGTVPVTGVLIQDCPYGGEVEIGKNYYLSGLVQPVYATNDSIAFTSSDNSVATVDASGKVVPLSVGTVKIAVTTMDGSYTDTCYLESVQPVKSVELNTTSIVLQVGETYQLVETISPVNATDQSVSWNSSNSLVASVDDGLVTALSSGTTGVIVTTTNGNKTDVCNVTVIDTAGLFIHKENDLEQHLEVFPNPANRLLYFNSKSMVENIVVSNISGQAVLFSKPCAKKGEIKIEHLPAGTYFVQFMGDGDFLEIIKIMVLPLL